MNAKTITLTNSYHNTEVRVRVPKRQTYTLSAWRESKESNAVFTQVVKLSGCTMDSDRDQTPEV